MNRPTTTRSQSPLEPDILMQEFMDALSTSSPAFKQQLLDAISPPPVSSTAPPDSLYSGIISLWQLYCPYQPLKLLLYTLIWQPLERGMKVSNLSSASYSRIPHLLSSLGLIRNFQLTIPRKRNHFWTHLLNYAHGLFH